MSDGAARRRARSLPTLSIPVNPDRWHADPVCAGNIELGGITDEDGLRGLHSREAERGGKDTGIGLRGPELVRDEDEINQSIDAEQGELGALHLGRTIGDDPNWTRSCCRTSSQSHRPERL